MSARREARGARQAWPAGADRRREQRARTAGTDRRRGPQALRRRRGPQARPAGAARPSLRPAQAQPGPAPTSPPRARRLPFVTLFDSWEDLVDKLAALDLEATSRAMRAHAALLEAQVVRGWRAAARRVADARDAREEAADLEEGPEASERRYAARMDALYGAGEWDLY